MDSPVLFTVPIPPTAPSQPAGGTITCRMPEQKVYLLTWTAAPDNRMTPAFCKALLDALDLVEFGGYGPADVRECVVVTTSGIPKFYSNGLDLELAIATEGFWGDCLFRLFKRFLTFPCPTIALIPGHAFAGGLMLAMYHDYRVGPGPTGKGYLCLNELDFGAPLKPAMSSVFRQKLGHATYRTLVLEARRFTGPQALEAGILDAVSSPAFATTAAGPGAGGAGAGTAGWEAVMQLVRERGLIGKGRTGVYGLMKMEMYRESLAYLEGHEREDERDRRLVQGEKKRREEGVRRAQAVKAQITKTASKL